MRKRLILLALVALMFPATASAKKPSVIRPMPGAIDEYMIRPFPADIDEYRAQVT